MRLSSFLWELELTHLSGRADSWEDLTFLLPLSRHLGHRHRRAAGGTSP